MKLHYILIALFITSCFNEGTSSSTKTENVEDYNLIDHLNQKSKKGLDKHINYRPNSLDTIEPEFLKQFVFGKPVSNLTFTFPEETWGSYFYLNHIEKEDFILFTFLHLDEVCCYEAYGITYSKQDDKPLSVELLGLDGGDGGWGVKTQSEWINDSTLELIEIESYDDLSPDTNGMSTLEIDTTWKTIHLNHKGIFSKELTDSIHVEVKEKFL